jgi:hypothetical protein
VYFIRYHYMEVRNWFNPRHTRCEIHGGQCDKGREFSQRTFLSLSVSFHQIILHIHSLIYHRSFVILATDSVVKQYTLINISVEILKD